MAPLACAPPVWSVLGRQEASDSRRAQFPVLLLADPAPFAAAIQVQEDSGVVQYAKTFDANEFAYAPLHSFGWYLTREWRVPLDGRVIARGIIMLILSGFSLALARGCRNAGLSDLAARAALVMLLILLLTPTLYPWYFAPAPALAALLPQPVFLLWTPLLPVTYWAGSHWYGIWTTALVHLPAWLSLLYLLRRVFPKTA
jgi:hypothetical protein